MDHTDTASRCMPHASRGGRRQPRPPDRGMAGAGNGRGVAGHAGHGHAPAAKPAATPRGQGSGYTRPMTRIVAAIAPGAVRSAGCTWSR